MLASATIWSVYVFLNFQRASEQAVFIPIFNRLKKGTSAQTKSLFLVATHIIVERQRTSQDLQWRQTGGQDEDKVWMSRKTAISKSLQRDNGTEDTSLIHLSNYLDAFLSSSGGWSQLDRYQRLRDTAWIIYSQRFLFITYHLPNITHPFLSSFLLLFSYVPR